ncbi:MAG: restriction endonuclease subunit R [Cyanobacteria bacterium P01_C01_bin.89]
MVQLVDASSLSLTKAREQLQLKRQVEKDFKQFLTLSPLSQEEHDYLKKVCESWERRVGKGKVSEGQVGVLAIAPILSASGYTFDPNLDIDIEKKIKEISIDDRDTVIRGRMDVIVSREWEGNRSPLCILVIESKNSTVSVSVGMPQLLAYASSFLKSQESVWGLVTNGSDYQFIRVESGLYREFSTLNLTRPNEAEEMLKVAIAIRKDFHENHTETQDKK